MNEFQARMFIEQILAQPTVPAAAQLVQTNVRALDEVFFMVLEQMIQAEQSAGSGSWGDSFEDRMAESLARIQSPSAPSQRLQALQMLQNFAFQQAQQLALSNLFQPQAPAVPRAATPPPLPKSSASPPPLPGAAKGFDYWLNEIKKMGAPEPSAVSASEPEPQDDMAKARKLMEIDRRYLPMMADILPGRANARVIAELKAVQSDYERLAKAGPPTFAFYTARDLDGKIADVLESLARAHDSLNQATEARDYYQRAIQKWTAVAQPDKARRCETALARLRLSTDGNVDDEIQRLQANLERTPPNSLARVQALVELAELQSGSGDDFAAEELLLQARDEMAALGYDSATGPSGTDLANALQQSLRGIMSGQGGGGPSPIEIQMQARDLQRRILLALAQIYRESDPAKAGEYLRQSKEMDGPGENQAFSQEMLKSLSSLFGEPPPPPRRQ